jgi:hypothetical protein
MTAESRIGPPFGGLSYMKVVIWLGRSLVFDIFGPYPMPAKAVGFTGPYRGISKCDHRI